MAPTFICGPSTAGSSPTSTPSLTRSSTPTSHSGSHHHRGLHWGHELFHKLARYTTSSTDVTSPPSSVRRKPTAKRNRTFTDPITGVKICENEVLEDKGLGEEIQTYLASNPPVLFEESDTFKRKVRNKSKSKEVSIFTTKDPIIETIEEEPVEDKAGSDNGEEYVPVGKKAGSSIPDLLSCKMKTPFAPPTAIPRSSSFYEDFDEDASVLSRSTSDIFSSCSAVPSPRVSPSDALPRVSSLRDLKTFNTSPSASSLSLATLPSSISSRNNSSNGSDEFKELAAQIKKHQISQRVCFDGSLGMGSLNFRNAERVIERRALAE